MDVTLVMNSIVWMGHGKKKSTLKKSFKLLDFVFIQH